MTERSDGERIAVLEAQQKANERRLAQIDQKLDVLVAFMSEAKGGWKFWLAMAGMVSAVSGAVGWILNTLIGKSP